jgi:hypothetical protein
MENDSKVAEYDRQHGTYKPALTNEPEDVRFPTGAMPKAPDPSPFKVGTGQTGPAR